LIRTSVVVSAIPSPPFLPEKIMTRTLLLDLDNTLLVNGLDTFLPAYLQGIADALKAYVEPERMLRDLLNATKSMVRNLRPDCTLKEVFDYAFYQALEMPQGSLTEPIERFYATRYGELNSLTWPRPGAVELVEAAFSLDFQVVIATNPLFPRTALTQRLEWAGLPPASYPFTLITSYEQFHFSKPHPDYYAEILGKLGWPDGPVLMVGDDLDHDILPAQALGISTFLLRSNGEEQISLPDGSRQGPDLVQALAWLKDTARHDSRPDFGGVPAMKATLRSTPAVLDSISRSLPLPTYKKRPQPDEWALTEVLCHLRDVEHEVNLPRLHKVLDEKNPFIAGMDTDPWAMERAYIRQDPLQALQRFIATRKETMELVASASPESWSRSARHAIFGPTTFSELLGIMAAHDRLHIQQVLQIIESVQGR
jgi:HAD superfamily hydrolase (TIGR01549 family)